MTQLTNHDKPRWAKRPQNPRQLRYKAHAQGDIYSASSQVTIYKDFNDNALEMPNRILGP